MKASYPVQLPKFLILRELMSNLAKICPYPHSWMEKCKSCSATVQLRSCCRNIECKNECYALENSPCFVSCTPVCEATLLVCRKNLAAACQALDLLENNIAGVHKKPPNFGVVWETRSWRSVPATPPSPSYSVSKYFKHLTTLHPKHCWPYLCLTFSNPIFSTQFS